MIKTTTHDFIKLLMLHFVQFILYTHIIEFQSNLLPVLFTLNKLVFLTESICHLR